MATATNKDNARPAASILSPANMNGHALNDPRWQQYVDSMLQVLLHETLTDGALATYRSAYDEDPDMLPKPKFTPKNKRVIVTGEFIAEMHGALAEADTGDGEMVVIAADHCESAKSFCEQNSKPHEEGRRCVAVVRGLKPACPIYRYALTCQITQGNQLIVEKQDYVPLPPNRKSIWWLMTRSKMNSEMKLTVLATLAGKKFIEEENDNDKPEKLLNTPEEMIPHLQDALHTYLRKSLSDKSKKISNSNNWNMKDADPADARDYARFWSHPETVRYFGGEMFRKLARYFQPGWLMGLKVGHNEFGKLYDMMVANPLQFCFPGAGHCFTSRKHDYLGVFCPNTDSKMRPLSLQRLLLFCMRENVKIPEDRLLLDVIVYRMAIELHITDLHNCTPIGMIERKTRSWYTNGARGSHIEDKSKLWDGIDRHFLPDLYDQLIYVDNNTVGFIDSREGQNMRTVLSSSLFDSDLIFRIQESISRLASDHWGYALYVCSVQFPNYRDLLKHLQVQDLDYDQLEKVIVYTASMYQTEALLLRGVDRMCIQAERLAETKGPMDLYMLPEDVLCCSEQLAALRFSIGYDANENHVLPSEAICNQQGAGGGGKSSFIELIWKTMKNPNGLLVVPFQNSHANVIKTRYPHIRCETLLRLLLKHGFMCEDSLPDIKKKDDLSYNQKKKINKQAEFFRNDFAAKYHEWELKYAGCKNHPPEPECLIYGYPFRKCPLEDVEVLVLEEFGTSPWMSTAVLINVVTRCCPKLRCIITMGDCFQLQPITSGHIQKNLLEGFGCIQWYHNHRSGQGPINNLLKAARLGDPNLLEFDGKLVKLIECGTTQRMMAEIKNITAIYGLHTGNSQIVTRTNDTCQQLSELLKRTHYNGGCQSVPGGVSAYQKMLYKKNDPSKRVCNNGRYHVHGVAHVLLQERYLTNEEQRAEDLLKKAVKKSEKERQRITNSSSSTNEHAPTEAPPEPSIVALLSDEPEAKVVEDNSNEDSDDESGDDLNLNDLLGSDDEDLMTLDEIMELTKKSSKRGISDVENPSKQQTKKLRPYASPSRFLPDIDQENRDWHAEADLAACQQQSEMVVSNMLVGDLLDEQEDDAEDLYPHLRIQRNVTDVVNEMHECVDSIESDLIPEELIPDRMTNVNLSNIPDTIFLPQPYIPRTHMGMELPLSSAAITDLMKDSSYKKSRKNKDECEDGTETRSTKICAKMMAVVPTTAQHIDNRLSKNPTDCMGKVVLCSVFKEFNGIVPPEFFKKEDLIYLPMTKKTQGLFKCGIAATGPCIQGNQTGCVIGVFPYVNEKDTRDFFYTLVSRSLVTGNGPAVILFFRNRNDMVRTVKQEPPMRFSCTGVLLKRVRDARRSKLAEMDYTQAAYLETVKEADGKFFGKRDFPFVDLLMEQRKCTTEREKNRLMMELMDMESQMVKPFGTMPRPARVAKKDNGIVGYPIGQEPTIQNQFDDDDDLEFDELCRNIPIPESQKESVNPNPKYTNYKPDVSVIDYDD